MNSSGDDDIVLVILAVICLPLAASTMVPAVQEWLLSHHILVPEPQAALSIPGADAGLDGRRLLIVAAALVVLIALSAWLRASTRRDPS